MNLDKILFIIDKLALDHEVHSSRIDCVVATNYTIQISESSPAGYITFTAYAKAAMAKRGWRELGSPCFDHDYSEVILCSYKHAVSPKVSIGTTWYRYDPIDPISEANALIDAIYAALEMETTT